jgi:hypothetical protein
VLSVRTLALIAPRALAWAPWLVFVLAPCADISYFAFNGFETTLLTATLMWVVARALDEGSRGAIGYVTALLLGTLPLIRSDAFYLWAGVAVVAVVATQRRRATLALVAASLALPLVQVMVRRAYYGEWLPNTFYLKVAGVHARWAGLAYAGRFLRAYAPPLLLCAYGAWKLTGRTRSILHASLTCAALALAYSVSVDGDSFPHVRFFAPLVPLLVAASFAAAHFVVADAEAARLLVTIAGLSVLSAAVGPNALISQNGLGKASVLAGLLILRHTQPEASIAVLAAGSTPYFSRRTAIDLLGKSDAQIAHFPPRESNPVGHMKFDIEYSLARRPDLVVSLTPRWLGTPVETPAQYCGPGGAHIWALPCSATFRAHYAAQRVRVRDLDSMSILVRDDSPESQRLDWFP